MQKKINPKGPIEGFDHVIRGGSFLNTTRNLLLPYRSLREAFAHYRYLGFRLVRTKRTKLEKILYAKKD